MDIGLSLVFIALCGAVLWQMHGVPPGLFEPLGPAPVPRAMAVLILLLAVIVLVRALHQLRAPAVAPAEPPAYRPRPLVAAGLGVVSVLYVVAMATGLVGFAVATTLFTVLAIGLLAGFQPRWLAAGLGIGLVTGFGLQYVFTAIFVIDLPT